MAPCDYDAAQRAGVRGRRRRRYPGGRDRGTAAGLHCEPRTTLWERQRRGRTAVHGRPRADRAGLGRAGDLYVGVEATETELGAGAVGRWVDDVPAVAWSHTSGDLGDGYVFVVDRSAGEIVFGADGTVGRRIPVGRQVHAWYRSGGGAAGNVRAAHYRAQGPGRRGVGDQPGTAGDATGDARRRPAESGQPCTDSGSRRDRSGLRADRGGVEWRRGRALAVSGRAWEGATPGVVRVMVLPTLDSTDPSAVTADALLERQVPTSWTAWDACSPSGSRSGVEPRRLGRAEALPRRATAVVNRAEDVSAVQARLNAALVCTLTPLPSGDSRWGFGRRCGRRPLRRAAGRTRRAVRRERTPRRRRVPGDVGALLADPHQPHTWFCASDGRIFRSGDDAEGWELLATFEARRSSGCRRARRRGLIVASSRVGDTDASRVRCPRTTASRGACSRRPTSTWKTSRRASPTAVRSCSRRRTAACSDRGHRRRRADPYSSTPPPAKPFYAVAVVSSGRRPAGRGRAGAGRRVRLLQAGRSARTHRRAHRGRRPAARAAQPGRRFLLAGAYATGDEAGAGVSRLELLAYQQSSDGWKPVGATWVGGSCRDLACSGERVFAATARAAVSMADTSKPESPWRSAAVDSGLPLREVGRFQPVLTVAAAGGSVLSGCVGGVYESADGRTWSAASKASFTERVSLPRTWLFAPSAHKLTVRYDDARA